MKTGFVNGFPKIPTLKYYKYHGQIYLCSTQPNPGPFKTYDTKEIPVEFKTMTFSASVVPRWNWWDFDYNAAHDNTRGTYYGPYIGQSKEDFGGGLFLYNIYRMGIIFDTINLPNDCEIWEVKFKTTLVNNWSSFIFKIVLQNGMPTYPHFVYDEYDYYYEKYSGDCGSAQIFVPGPFEIILNDYGRSLINKEGYTKFMLLSDQDIDRILPIANDTVGFYDDEGFYFLEVTYLEAP